MQPPENLTSLQTVDRALQILSWFTPAQPELTVAQVSRYLGVGRSVASRLLAALEARQFVTQDPETGRFRLGVRNLDLGALFLQSHRLVGAATPYLEQLVRDRTLVIGANLFTLDNGEALRLASYPARPLTRLRVATHCTAAGKALLASLPDADVERVIAERGLPPQTAHTITTVAALWEDLHQVRLRGYATDLEENHFGSFCYAAPIRDISRRTVGAVSVSLTDRPTGEQAGRLIQSVIEAARRISESLGSGPLWTAVSPSQATQISS